MWARQPYASADPLLDGPFRTLRSVLDSICDMDSTERVNHARPLAFTS